MRVDQVWEEKWDVRTKAEWGFRVQEKLGKNVLKFEGFVEVFLRGSIRINRCREEVEYRYERAIIENSACANLSEWLGQKIDQ